MKMARYYFSIFLSVLISTLPIICLVLSFLATERLAFPLRMAALLSFVVFLLFRRSIDEMRIQARQNAENDEFGRPKKKGTYARLSKKEREAIDLQKIGDLERIMSSSVIERMTAKGSTDPRKDMDSMIGLDSVKQRIKEIEARMIFEAEERERNKKKKKASASSSGGHMVFFGSPGTGKTTVARIMTGFLYKYGYIRVNKCIEIDGNFLRAGTETATKTTLVINHAYDGVLFIDEAYALAQGDKYGQEAIATIIKRMEDDRARFVLILAGYTDEMRLLISRNPGFKSRIKDYIEFQDYSIYEMEQIFQKMANEKGYIVSEGAIASFNERIAKEIKRRDFGNARTVRNILDESLDKHAYNCVCFKTEEEKRYVITAQDITRTTSKF